MKNYFIKHALLPEGWSDDVRICVGSKGIINKIETKTRARYHDTELDCIIPMVPNCHSHVFQRAMAGMTEYKTAKNDSFWSWRDLMYQYANKIDSNQLYHIAKYTYSEMLHAGYSSVCEFHYIHRDLNDTNNTEDMSLALIKAAHEVGIRLILLPVLYTQAHINGLPLDELQQRFKLSVEEYCQLYKRLNKHLYPNQQLGICFHSLRAVSLEQMHEVLQQLDDGKCVIHIHIAEQNAEIEQIYKHTGKRPVELLFDKFQVNERWCLIHATHLTGDEISIISQSKAIVGLCPITEANLGDGVFSMDKYMQFNGRFALGSDSNITLNPFAELQLLEYSQRLKLKQRNVCCNSEYSSVGSYLWNEVVNSGNLASGLMLAGIKVGNEANFINLNSENALLTGLTGEKCLDTYIFTDATLSKEIHHLGENINDIDAQIIQNYKKTLKSLR